MAVYKCAGRKRGHCAYESEEKWCGQCPGCGRWYDCQKVGVDKAEASRTTLATLNTVEDVRISTGIKEFDEVIGGGLVPGSTMILSGPPGQGKTTLLLETCDHVARAGHRVIYASGEQNAEDIGRIAGRIKIANEKIEVMGLEGDIEKIVDRVEATKTKLVIVDSLQKAFMDDVDGSVGSTSQINAVIEHLIYFCKKKKVCAIVVSHVNKAGEIAGPRGAEHDVDTLVELDPYYLYDDDGELDEESKELRELSIGPKNRNGPPGTRAVFRMTAEGIKPVKRKSKLTLV